MNVDTGIWEKLSRVVICLIVIAVLLVIVEWNLPVIRQNERMRKEIHALDADIKKAEEDNKRLKSSIESMRDPRTIERLAREKLSFARTGETIIRFEAPLTNQVISRPATNSN